MLSVFCAAPRAVSVLLRLSPKEHNGVVRSRQFLFLSPDIDQITSRTVIRTHDLVTPDFGRGAQAFKQIISRYRTAFPDSHCTIDETVIQGDMIAARWTARGTNTGSLGNNVPTGRKVLVTGVDLLKISNGKIVECHVIWDAAGRLKLSGSEPDPESFSLIHRAQLRVKGHLK
jgi:predicted ester cyclase